VIDADVPPDELGGLEIVDLLSNVAVCQVPVEQRTGCGVPMTRNPFWIESTPRGLRAYFIPEDGTSTIHVYDVDTA